MCEYFVKADPIQYEQRSRTVRIKNVLTSLRLENMVWDILAEMAEEEGKEDRSGIIFLMEGERERERERKNANKKRRNRHFRTRVGKTTKVMLNCSGS